MRARPIVAVLALVSPSRPPMRPAVILLAALTAAPPLTAQTPQAAGVTPWAYGFQYDEGWELGAREENRKEEGSVLASARKGSAYAQASATPITGQLRGSAYSGHWRDVGMSGASIAQYVTITNTAEDTRWYELEMYLHARGYGQCQVTFRCPPYQPVASATFWMTAWLVDDAGTPSFQLGSANLGANLWTDGMRPVEQEFFEERLAGIRVLPGTNRYLLDFTIRFEAIAGFDIIGEQTATVFLPQGDGITVTAEGDFLDRQARPSWATTAVPEPATLALLGAGLLVVAGVGARQRSGGVLGGVRRQRVACS